MLGDNAVWTTFSSSGGARSAVPLGDGTLLVGETSRAITHIDATGNWTKVATACGVNADLQPLASGGALMFCERGPSQDSLVWTFDEHGQPTTPEATTVPVVKVAQDRKMTRGPGVRTMDVEFLSDGSLVVAALQKWRLVQVYGKTRLRGDLVVYSAPAGGRTWHSKDLGLTEVDRNSFVNVSSGRNGTAVVTWNSYRPGDATRFANATTVFASVRRGARGTWTRPAALVAQQRPSGTGITFGTQLGFATAGVGDDGSVVVAWTESPALTVGTSSVRVRVRVLGAGRSVWGSRVTLPAGLRAGDEPALHALGLSDGAYVYWESRAGVTGARFRRKPPGRTPPLLRVRSASIGGLADVARLDADRIAVLGTAGQLNFTDATTSRWLAPVAAPSGLAHAATLQSGYAGAAVATGREGASSTAGLVRVDP